nr:MAG TPA: hypothetical protein [Caudoviricetes sp.]
MLCLLSRHRGTLKNLKPRTGKKPRKKDFYSL